MLLSRAEKVLKAAMRDYILRGEPIASEDLCERHNFGVKSASIRAELLSLTKQGFLMQQHISGGRIPTEKGYRFFVDQIYANIFDEDRGAEINNVNNSFSFVEDIFSGQLDNFVDTFSVFLCF